jgi:hypothetical protein
MKIPRHRGIVPFAFAGAGLLTVDGCGPSAPLFRSTAPAMEEFVSAEIPLRFDRGYPVLILHAGADSVEVLLDTGAGRIGIGLPPETVRSMRLRGFGGTRTIETNAGRISYRRVILPEARFGGITFRNLACDRVSGDLHPAFAGRGIAGLALLRPFNALIDYRASRLVLFRRGYFPADFDSSSWRRIPFDDHPDGMLIDGTPDGIPGELKWCLDTGAIAVNPERTEYFNLLKPKYFRGLKGVQERDGRAFASHRAFRSGGVALDSLNFLEHAFSEPGGVDGFLGADFFMKNRVLIDFADAVLWLQPCR